MEILSGQLVPLFSLLALLASMAPIDESILFTVSGEIWVMDPQGGSRERLVQGIYPRLSPDGRRIAFCRW